MAKLQFEIGNRMIGAGSACLVVGEVAQAHDGSLGTAHAFIDAIAAAGAEAVKFQTHIAHAESSPQEQFRIKFSHQDATRYDYWKRMEFTPEQWASLSEHAHQRGLLFLSSPFSEEAIELLEGIGMPAWKIASGEVNNPILLDRIIKTRKPILLSTGMSTLVEIDQIVERIKTQNLALAVFQCTSKYPSQPEDVGLNMLEVYRNRYGVPVGLSDHSGKIFPGLTAASLGASIVEVHVVLSRDMFGPDVPVSLTPPELGQLVEGTRFIEKMLANPVGKDRLDAGLADMRRMFGKSLVAARDLKAGQQVERSDLTARKPAIGIPVAEIETVLGKPLKRNVARDEFLHPSDLDMEALA
jgi:N,N'-diacetyllegionaminate synthase